MPAAAVRGAPPGPAGYPLVGVFPMARRDPLGFFADCVRRHGDVVAMRLGPHRALLLRHPADVKHVLQDRAAIYAKGPTAVRVRALFGESLTVMDGEGWRRRRRQLQPALSPGRHECFAAVVSETAAEALAGWEPLAARGAPLELTAEMRRLTQRIIIRFCFGAIPEEELRPLCAALDVAVAHVDRRLWSPLGWLDVPALAGGRYPRALAVMETFISRRTAEACRSAPPPGTVLDALLAASPDERLAAAELHHELRAVLFAGHTTTASALAWLWYVLSEHPDTRERIEEECHAVLGGRLPVLEDLPGLSHTRRVIDEVLRLYPPTWLTARSPTEDDSLGGYAVPAGALVLLSPYLTHRHPALWRDPERFDPDRFAPARAAMRPGFAYFPFGGGPRRCIGSALATIEMQMIAAMVVQRYRLARLPGARVVPVAGLTLRPGPAMPVRLVRR
jgi:cytochrome P450